MWLVSSRSWMHRNGSSRAHKDATCRGRRNLNRRRLGRNSPLISLLVEPTLVRTVRELTLKIPRPIIVRECEPHCSRNTFESKLLSATAKRPSGTISP